MQNALIYYADPDSSSRLQADMKCCGWAIDVCDGMLETLRLIEERKYEVVVINAKCMNTETCAMIGMIGTLSQEPKVLLNLTGSADSTPLEDLPPSGSVIVGELTWEKFLHAASAEN